MRIRDSVHTDIELNDLEAEIIDFPEMQRLRGVKQVGFSYLVYPGAHHTRFEHSLGSMKVVGDIMDNLPTKDQQEIRLVALLHDIGHGPFSHSTEPIISRHLKKSHEQLGKNIIVESGIKDLINTTASFKKVSAYFDDEDKCALVGGSLGADRIDYLMRDAHYTGVAFGIIDYARIIGKLTYYKGMPAIYEQAVAAAESLLIARYFMFRNVYQHHATQIGEGMMLNALEMALDEHLIQPSSLLKMTDEDMIARLGVMGGDVSRSIRRVRERNLYKRAYYDNVDKSVRLEEIEDALSRAGYSPMEYVVKMIGFGGGGDDMAVIDHDGRFTGWLTELSPLVKTLTNILKTDKRLLVACDKRDAQKMGRIVDRVL